MINFHQYIWIGQCGYMLFFCDLPSKLFYLERINSQVDYVIQRKLTKYLNVIVLESFEALGQKSPHVR